MSIVIAVLGATSLLGENLLEILGDRKFPASSVRLADSDDKEARGVMFAGHAVRITTLSKLDLSGVKILFNCMPGGLTAEMQAQMSAQAGFVIDLTSSVDSAQAHCAVPEVNPDVLDSVASGSVICSPGAAVVAASVALAVLHRRYQILRLNVTSLCSVAHAGHDGIKALAGETARLLNGRDAEPEYFSRQVAFNLLPQTGEIQDSGYTLNEWQLADQLRELLADDQLEIAVSELQIPLFYGQAVVVHAETQHRVELDEMRQLLGEAAGVYLARLDEEPLTPVSTAAGKDEVFISRLRVDRDSANGFSLCALTDNLRKGGALNAVQIAESLIGRLG